MKIRTLVLFFILLASANGYAFEEKFVYSGQIAVECLTGRGGKNEFSGWVGSFSIDFHENAVLISEFANLSDDKISVVNVMLKIIKLEEGNNHIYFETLSWTGKLWVNDSNEYKVEMINKTMPIRLTPKAAERRFRHSCHTPGCSHAPSYSPA